jgi:hypothetical protein
MSSRPVTSCSFTVSSWLKARERGLGDDQAVDAVRVIRREGVGDHHPGVGPVDGEALVAQGVHQRDQVVGQGGAVVAARGLT